MEQPAGLEAPSGARAASGRRGPLGLAQPAASIQGLKWDFQELGLSSYETRILLALFELGSATPVELAEAADVPRTSVYPVLKELRVKQLAGPLPGEGKAVWSSPGPRSVVDLLEAAQEDQLSRQKARAARMREAVDAFFPASSPALAFPYLDMIHDPSKVKPCYERMLRSATSELMVYNRPPFSETAGKPNPLIIEVAGRVRARALYDAARVTDPSCAPWRSEMETYHAAGVDGRLVDQVPMKLAIVDRRMTLFTLEDPELPNVGYPVAIYMEHPGVAVTHALAFEYLWERSRPFPR